MRRTKKMALMALFFAITVVLSFFEASLPPVPLFPPGVKLGLANVIVMFVLLCIGKGEAFTIIMLKSIFVFITRGSMAGFLSLCGGVCAFLGIITLMGVIGKRHTPLCLIGGVLHNVGQFLGISLVLGGFVFLAYLPALVLAGVLAGMATAVLLNRVVPALKHVQNRLGG